MNWTLIWAIWVIIALVSFGILEWQGIRRKGTEGSLSWQVWRILFTDADRRLKGEHPRKPRPVVYFLLLAPMLWLLLHFALGGRLG